MRKSHSRKTISSQCLITNDHICRHFNVFIFLFQSRQESTWVRYIYEQQQKIFWRRIQCFNFTFVWNMKIKNFMVSLHPQFIEYLTSRTFRIFLCAVRIYSLNRRKKNKLHDNQRVQQKKIRSFSSWHLTIKKNLSKHNWSQKRLYRFVFISMNIVFTNLK